MPIYDYECIKCHNIEERRVIFWEALQFCNKCSYHDEPMKRLFSTTGITFRMKMEKKKIKNEKGGAK